MTVFQSCSLLKNEEVKSNSLMIKSEIDKIEVYNEKNEKLGETPLTLDASQMGPKQNVYFIFKKAGYFEKEMSLNNVDLAEINVTLSPIGDDFIKKNLDKYYTKEVNNILKKTVLIQEYISLRDYTSAEAEANKLLGTFPSASIIYTLLGVIEINKKNYKLAEIHLLKALNLDSNDTLAQNYLSYIKKGIKSE